MLLCGNKATLVSGSFYTNFVNYDKQAYVEFIFDCSNCKKIKFSTISNNRFILQFGTSTTTSISYTNVLANEEYSLENYNYFGLRLNLAYANYAGNASGGFGTITIE